jgi:hypothetical protein
LFIFQWRVRGDGPYPTPEQHLPYKKKLIDNSGSWVAPMTATSTQHPSLKHKKYQRLEPLSPQPPQEPPSQRLKRKLFHQNYFL